jgi:aryl-alcohol dehydrogenase-like predicted oxidoreductase
MPLVAWSALARGWFAETHAADSEDWTADDTRRVYDSPINRERRERARSLARELGLSTATVALAWVLHQSFPTWAVAGPRSLDELEASAAAANLDLTPDQTAFLERG